MKTFFRNSIILIIFLCPLVSNGQYGNRFVLGFSSSGFYIADRSDLNNVKKQLYVEVIPFIGIKCKENFYVYAELGRSFSNSQGYPEIPKFSFAGSFMRWYMLKHNIVDFYSGFGLSFSNLKYLDGNSVKTQSLSNVKYLLYGGLSFKLFKRLHLATDIGYRYQKGINNFTHYKITLQYGF